MKKLLMVLALSGALVACNDSNYDDKNDNDHKDTVVKKEDSTVKDSSVVNTDTVKLNHK
jgi:hypothetical protein